MKSFAEELSNVDGLLLKVRFTHQHWSCRSLLFPGSLSSV